MTDPAAARYRQLSEHFQACAELSPEERNRYITTKVKDDPELREELRSLLSLHPAGAAEPATPTPATLRGGTRRRKPRPGRSLLIILARGIFAALLILVARAWSVGRLETDLRRQADSVLQLSVEARASEIRAWADQQKSLARKVLEDPALASNVAVLKKIAEETNVDKEKIKAAPSFGAIVDAMKKVPAPIGELGFVMITSAGVDLCSENDEIVGRVVTPSGASYLRRCVLGEWILSRPYPDRQFAQGVTPDYSRLVMFVAGPIYDAEKNLLGMGVFRFNPHREFYKLLPPETPRMIAFDEKGLVLNDYGETDLLRKLGLLPGMEPGESGILRLRLRDPGGDLRTGFQPGTPPEQWAPTAMSLRTSEAPPGIQTDSYRDVLGRPVRGAWTWLPEWEMGLGAEEEEQRILAPAKAVNVTFLLILGIPVLYTIALLLGARPIRSWFGAPAESTFGSYVLERSIGKGGMAEVFLARHDILKRPTAVKVLSNPHPDEATVARFEREARLACRLGHPNTIQIFDYGETPEGKLYYAMEYVKGLNLAQLMSLEARTPVSRAIYLLRQIAGSLAEAHSMGLVHRDLKPSNIMVCEKGGLFGVVKVLDFGIATSFSSTSEDFTRSVELLGTPAYMAPERIREPQVQNPRSDIYSFGAVAFHLLTGRHVFEGPGPAEVIYQVMSADRPSPSQLRGDPLPAALEKLVLDCLQINPDARPADFETILDLLDRVEVPEPWTREKSREWWESNRRRLGTFL